MLIFARWLRRRRIAICRKYLRWAIENGAFDYAKYLDKKIARLEREMP